MSKRVLFIGLSMILFVFSSLPGIAEAQTQASNFSGRIKGAPFRIRVPANWNGTLLVYVHGYRDKFDNPGDVDNRTADIAPNAALEPVLLAQGYALSGSAFRDNGWAVKEGIEDTKNLVINFRRLVGAPQRTILWGFSMGSVISFKSIEQNDGFYDGALCGCAVGGGTSRAWDSSLDFSLAYDTVFGFPSNWGTVGDVDDFLNFEDRVLPKLSVELNTPANFPKFEFIRLIAGTPGRGIMPPPPPNFYPNWVLTDMFFATEFRAELERRAGGPIVQNLNRDYFISVSEREYLNSLGMSNAVIDQLLNQMNAQRNISAPAASRDYLAKYADFTGNILKPVLTMHTLLDPLVPVSHENQYFRTVQAAGKTDLLFQTYTNGNGHCAFTAEQLITAVNAINNWVANGNKPTQANFPASLGFLQGFQPPAMNQP
jgi:predicted esterase